MSDDFTKNNIEERGVQTSDITSRVVGRPTVPTGKYLTMLYSVSGRTISLGIGTSSSGVWLGQASGSTTHLRVKCYKNGSLIQTKEFNNIANGIANPSTISFSIPGTDAATVTISCMCSSCDDGVNHTGSGYEYEFDDSFTVSLAASQITPSTPVIAIYAPNNGSSGRIDYTNVAASDATYRCYPAETSSGSGTNNTLRFYIGRPGNATQCRIVIDRWLSSTGWTTYSDTGWLSEVILNVHKTFSSADRISSGAWWRVRSHAKSSTGHTSMSSYIHFIINDVPYFTSNQPSISCPSIVTLGSSATVSWNSANNSYLTTGYKLRYKRQQDSSWTEKTVSGTSTSVSFSDTSTYPRGTVIQFQVAAYDSYDSGSFFGSASVKINSLPYANSSTITTNKDDSKNNKRYVDNVTFSLPTISDSDGQSTSYKTEYNVGNGWVVYNSSTTSTSITINCSSYQNTRGGSFQFRAVPYDGMEYGSYIYSATLYKNRLPTTSSSTITSNKDDSTNNKRYVDNVTFTLPTISDADGHSVSYKTEYNVGSGWVVYNSSTTSTSITINCSSYQNTRGGSFQFRAVPYDGLEYGSYIYSSTLYKNQLPTLGSSTITTDKDGSPYYNHYVNNVTFYFPSISDSDGHSTKYRVEYKVGSGSWTLYSSSYSSSSLTLNCSNYQNTRGQSMQLRVTAYDGFEYGSTATSAVLIRNQLPAAPSLTIDYGKKYLSESSDSPHNGHVEKIYQIKWNNISNYCNGQKIANSNVKVRFYRNSGNELYATYSGQDIDNMGGIPRVIDNHYINSVTRGNPFKVIVEVTDILGESNSTQISYTRNSLPTVPTGFSVGFSGSVETVTNRQVLFTKSSDLDNDTIYYHLQVKRYNTTQWVDLKNNYTTASTSVVWNLVDNSSHYGDVYRIRAIDEHGAESNWNSLEDTQLLGANITYPISVIYGPKPRILFKLVNDNTNRYMNVEISVNGQKYNNLSNYQYFSLPIYKENSLGVFRCPINLVAGNNTIIIKTFLGSISSSQATSTLVYNVCLENEIIQGTIITASRMSNIQKMINDYYSAYGCSFAKNEMINIQGGATISITQIFNNIFNNIIAINNTINNYDKDYCSNDKLRVTIANLNVNNTTKHLVDQINTIVDIIKNKI